MRFFTKAVYVFVVLFTSYGLASAQIYGLEFSSYKQNVDQRTGLDLSPGRLLKFDKDFELSFDLSFNPESPDYFGYVFRIIDAQHRNIDLLYNTRRHVKEGFNVVIGEKLSSMTFDMDKKDLFNRWVKFKLAFDHRTQLFSLTAGKTTVSQRLTQGIPTAIKILFGVNQYESFRTTDIPPMKIRDIQIKENGRLKYYWPLKERDGKVAHEEIAGMDASVVNPHWIIRSHSVWQANEMCEVNGPASLAFDSKHGVLWAVGTDSLTRYDLVTGKLDHLAYRSGDQQLQLGNQSLYDTLHDRLINFFIDEHLVSVFDFQTRQWSAPYPDSSMLTGYWLPNAFYSPTDTSLYMLAGYGYQQYKNKVQRYHFSDKQWTQVSTRGSFTPRYLAALGATDSGAYLLGGYGSKSGLQILNPRNLYDLLYFDVQHQSIRKVYTLQKPGDGEFVFANSMVIDPQSRYYYAMIFPRTQFNADLQLIQGSLDTPTYYKVANAIPFQFRDNAFTTLYYFPAGKRLISASTYYDKTTHKSTISVYSLQAPPIAFIPGEPSLSKFWSWWRILLAVGGVLFGAGVVLFWMRRRRRSATLEAQRIQALFQDSAAAPEARPHEMARSAVIEEPAGAPPCNTIFFFGDFQAFDRQGVDLSGQFTPLLRELFLVLALHTFSHRKGISDEKLIELLWADKSPESARNNRSVNIAKLKHLIQKLDGVHVQKDAHFWKIEVEAPCQVDYVDFLQLMADKTALNKQNIQDLVTVIKKGSFLSNIEHSWLDAFKLEVFNEVIDSYLTFTRSVNIAEDAYLLIELANYIFYFDPVNEEAIALKCKSLAYLGKHSLARYAFENFCKEYQQLYGEGYARDFNSLLI